ncbi:DUF1330 domain-containing protein [Paraglaciecola arctica]|uniref:DUF1330 domain-containing protein n=1 Tax=Paraglaciecola arctica TaxID=1128911 RepID=UPI001C06E3EF|nr:DUF1330 domain-containing protein [Paraglaciecola arctica]MBU3006178.1 DUF1330 domain-containing protein [Paraglaciecola arctica]
MKTLVTVDLNPIDKTTMAEYSQLAAKTLEGYGGQFIAKGPVESLHGESPYTMKAVIEFPDKQSAKSWYTSEAYQAIIPLRNKGMDSQFQLV